MDEKEEKIKLAQELRKKINLIVSTQVRPMREKYHKTLTEIAELLCPFKAEDIVILPNGKKGIITQVDYTSLDYEFQEEFGEVLGISTLTKDDFNYLFSYTEDNKKFDLTWKISGLRLKKNDKPGLVRFSDLSPLYHIIDVQNNKISDKPMSAFMGSDNIAFFDTSDISDMI